MSCIVEEMAVQKQMENIEIHRMARGDIPRMQAIADKIRHVKDIDYFARNFDFVEEGEREALLATYDGQDAGYCFLNWLPKYSFFKKLNIPEIQDLSVSPDMRRLGLATAMILYCEAAAIDRGYVHMGIGVAVNASYGPAQVLYGQLGYVPDGNGVTYDRKLVAAGTFKPLDDQLCMMMVKSLGKPS